MTKVYIYGASKFGMEVYKYKAHTNLANVEFGGFIADKQYVDDCIPPDLYIGDKDVLKPRDNLIVAIGRNLQYRRKLINELIQKGVEFPNMIHNTVLIASEITSIGNIIFPFTSISCNVKIGNFNFMSTYVAIGHDVAIGDFNSIISFSHIMGNCRIGDCNHIGSGVHMLPNSRIGDENLVAPGSFIYKGFKNNCVISGNPAVRIRKSWD